MNPELETPERTRQCPECEGWRYTRSYGTGMNTAYLPCPKCEGTGILPLDPTDSREDAAEARRESRLDK